MLVRACVCERVRERGRYFNTSGYHCLSKLSLFVEEALMIPLFVKSEQNTQWVDNYKFINEDCIGLESYKVCHGFGLMKQDNSF